MKKKLNVEGAYVVHHELHRDNRGYFCEYEHYPLNELVPHYDVQNLSYSVPGTLRGLHVQSYPQEQSKYVTCVHGKVYDFFVDLRVHSPSYLQVDTVVLDSSQLCSVYVPRGVAHGFYAPVHSTVLYGVNGVRVPKLELSINPLVTFNEHVVPHLTDEERKNLQLHGTVLSQKDNSAPDLKSYVANKYYVVGGGLFD